MTILFTVISPTPRASTMRAGYLVPSQKEKYLTVPDWHRMFQLSPRDNHSYDAPSVLRMVKTHHPKILRLSEC